MQLLFVHWGCLQACGALCVYACVLCLIQQTLSALPVQTCPTSLRCNFLWLTYFHSRSIQEKWAAFLIGHSSALVHR